MRIIIATDSFKGSLTSIEAGQAIKEGITRIISDAEIDICPIADGGEGTVTALVSAMNGTLMHTEVEGPLGDKVLAEWGVIGNSTAVIEMASAAGITLLQQNELNPLYTSTYGVGELINVAIKEGCRHFVIGIGGSCTNDGGLGMLEALGLVAKDEDGNRIQRGAIGLSRLKTISREDLNSNLEGCTFRIVCDVQNPLCGENGCSRVYGSQKGATEEQIVEMDSWLQSYAQIAGGNPNIPGAGAAGGLGFAFRTFLNASLERGIDIVIEETGLESRIKDADLIITGEGRIDSQTVMGKVPVGVASIAKKYNKKVIAFCGCASEDASVCNMYGIDAIFPIIREVITLEEALDKTQAKKNLIATSEQVARLIDSI